MRELQSVIFDEMQEHLIFWCQSAPGYEFPEDTSKWNETEKALDGIIRDRFDKAVCEITDARICYALGRYTACVFHLMWASEVAIKAIYKTLGLSAPNLSDSWGTYSNQWINSLLLPWHRPLRLGKENLISSITLQMT